MSQVIAASKEKLCCLKWNLKQQPPASRDNALPTELPQQNSLSSNVSWKYLSLVGHTPGFFFFSDDFVPFHQIRKTTHKFLF